MGGHTAYLFFSRGRCVFNAWNGKRAIPLSRRRFSHITVYRQGILRPEDRAGHPVLPKKALPREGVEGQQRYIFFPFSQGYSYSPPHT